jgi:excisionase family DNA binding protein
VVSRPRGVLSTGQAARFCLVTADTVGNWIRSGLLRARRTAGGQYRILASDLREFMVARGMSPEDLPASAEPTESRLPCWRFRVDPSGDTECGDCIVRHLKVLDCFKLMGMRPADGRPVRDCADCEYFRRYGEVDRT